ncbi:SulP family inorganic anion transporter [Amphibiibacter pelophylacis]|uniref:Sulfate permease n=1 Tax=Amphibiibacter pelophylacis TaxID=1799477 RepID=A0ACC6NZ95_9BURK
MIVILEAARAGLLQRRHWGANLVAGVIVGVVALPLSMAFAIASGAKPEQGLYTAIVAGLAVSLLGGSRLQIAGPTGAFIVILADITARYGIAGLQVATLMAGVMLLLMGLARFGAVIRFIPAPVITGFTTGIAIIIWVGQWKEFFGLPAVSGGHFHEKFWHLLQSLPQFHVTTTLLALMSLALVIFSKKIPGMARVPGPLVALVVATIAQGIFQFQGVNTIGSAFGELPSGLPTLQWPEMTFARLVELIGPAFTIAMLGAIESLLSAVVADGMAGTRHDSNQELIGQGVANVLSPLFGGFAATGAIARTATNIRNGGTSPLAGVVHALTLVAVLLFLAPLAKNVPLAALAAILFVVAWNMSELPHLVHLLRHAPRADIVILLVTLALTVFADLVIAVNIGVILASFHFLRRMAASMEVRQASAEEIGQQAGLDAGQALPEGLLVFNVDGPFFFGAADNFRRALESALVTPKVLILRLRWVPYIDATGLETLAGVIRSFQAKGVRVMLSGASERVQARLKRGGILKLVGESNHFAAFEQALQACRAMPRSDEASGPASVLG